MLIIPAIDLINGECVRLEQGDYSKKTSYSASPVEIAKLWQRKGAKRLHLVDLDGALSGSSANFDVVKNIRKALDITIDLGGGIRTAENAKKMFDIGIDRVIFGTAAAKNPDEIKRVCEKFPEKITVGIDAKNEKIAISGWTGTTKISAEDLVLKMESFGVDEFIYTDISKDGMLSGPNLESTQKICKITKQKIIASGGISSLQDIKNLIDLKQKNLVGIIAGKAIYTQKFDLEEAIDLAKNYVS